MSQLTIQRARVLPIGDAPFPHRGAISTPLTALDRHDVRIQDGQIHRIDPHDPALQDSSHTIDAAGCVLMPAFVDCHTHTCFAGNRREEWQRKLAGATYLELLESGGGIMSTVRAVRQASQSQLTEQLLSRLDRVLRAGTLTIEVKSGYGLSTTDELKMLRAICLADQQWPGTVIPTACIGHALDPSVDAKQFVHQTIHETLPAVSAEFPGVTIDAYCEKGAWSVEDCRTLFDRAHAAGHAIRVHADQFHSLGMVELAAERPFRSVDHLEATPKEELERLAQSPCFGVMLPACGFHLDGRYGDGRSFLDRGGALAIATNYNPGSAPCFAMPMIIALAVRHLNLTVAEAITACTANAAALLGLSDRGNLQPGQRADLILLDLQDEAQLAFEFGANPVRAVVARGNIVHQCST